MGSTNSASLKVRAKNVRAHYIWECIIHGKIRYLPEGRVMFLTSRFMRYCPVILPK